MSYPPGPPGPHDAEEPGPADAPRPPGEPGDGQPAGPPPPGYGAPGGYPGGPQQGAPGQGPHPGYPGPRPTNTKATAALITGITTLVLSWCCGAGVLGAIAIVLGVRARSEIRSSQGTQEGDGIALAGIITGAAAVVIGLLVLVAIVAVIASGQADYYNDFS
ncbi:MAG TPA: DUF4190 domain-containing protein [Nocardioidaceae bacterium]|nr:DUF4190 domain-containing protein [Nocardioidaceae bacterium]